MLVSSTDVILYGYYFNNIHSRNMRQWENKNRTCGMEHRYGLYLSYTLASANPNNVWWVMAVTLRRR